MIGAILKLILAVLIIWIFIVWLLAVANWDGECHGESCKNCPYDGNCPVQEKRDRKNA